MTSWERAGQAQPKLGEIDQEHNQKEDQEEKVTAYGTHRACTEEGGISAAHMQGNLHNIVVHVQS